MKILLCHDYYRQSGGERVAVEAQAELLAKRGHRVVRLARDNREIDRFSTLNKLRFPLDTLYSRRTVREVEQVVARERPDVAHVHNVFPLLSPSLYRALAAAGVPVVQTLHNYRFLCPNGLFFTHGQVCERCSGGNTVHAIRLRCYRDSRTLSAVYAASIGLHRQAGTFRCIDRFLALTPFAARKVVEAGLAPASRVEVLGSFLPEPLTPLPFDQREDYALFLGRLSEEKGADLAVAAVADLPEVALRVAGEGPDRQQLERRAAAAGERIRLLGYRSGHEKEALLRRAGMLVVPSRCYEGLPFSVLEALSAGVPIVAADHGGLRELLAEAGAGRLHRPGDAHDLRRHLGELAGDPAERERLGRNARRLFEERYGAEAHYRRLLEIYRDLTRRTEP